MWKGCVSSLGDPSVDTRWFSYYLTNTMGFHVLLRWCLFIHSGFRRGRQSEITCHKIYGLEGYMIIIWYMHPDSKVHGAKMGPIWGRKVPGGSHVGPMNFAIWAFTIFSLNPCIFGRYVWTQKYYYTLRFNKKKGLLVIIYMSWSDIWLLFHMCSYNFVII